MGLDQIFQPLKTRFLSLNTRQRALILSASGVTLTVLTTLLIWGFSSSIAIYARPKFAVVTEPLGMWLREEPSTESERILVLKRGTVLTVLGETKQESTVPGVGKAKWFKIKTRSGHEGFGFGTLCRFTFEDEANRMISRDKSLFEDRLKILIVRAAQARIRDSGLFPYDNIADLTIVTPLEPQSSSSYSVRVDALMIGALLGVDKQRVAAIVNLDMEVDLNQLNSSDVRVRHVDVLDYKRLEGIEPGRAVDLLAKVL